MSKKKQKTKAELVKNTDFTIIFSIVIAVLAMVQYANTLNHDYAWDDAIVIRDNAYTQNGLSSLKDIWTKPVYIPQREIYRPIPQTTFALEKHFFPNGNPQVGHLINILLYAFCCFLLFHFFKRIIPQYHLLFAFLASLLFVVHPIHTEAVANIKSRDEILSMCFGLASLIYFMKFISKRNIIHIILSVFLLICSCLSKLNAITLIAIYPLLYYFYSNNTKQKINQYNLFSSSESSNGTNLLENLSITPKVISALSILAWLGLSIYLNNIYLAILLGLFIGAILITHFKNIKPWDFIFLIAIYLILGYFFKLQYTREVAFILFLTYISKNDLWNIKYFIPIIILLIPLVLNYPANLILAFAFYFLLNKNIGKWTNYLLIAYTIFGMIIVYLGNYIDAALLGIIILSHILKRFESIHKLFPVILVTLLTITTSIEITFYNIPDNIETNSTNITIKKSDVLELSIINNSLINLPDHKKQPTIAKIQLEYIKKAFFPHPLIHNYGFDVIKSVSWKSPIPWISLLVFFLIFIIILKKINQKDPIVLGILIFFITLSIYTNILVLAPDTMAERFLYFPSIGFCLAFIFLWAGITKVDLGLKPFANTRNILFYSGIGLILGLGFYKTMDRNKAWKDNKTLATNTLPYANNSALINANHGGEWMHHFEVISQSTDQQALNKAIKSSERALEIHPNYLNVIIDLGLMYLAAGEVDKAEQLYIDGLAIDSNYPSFQLNLGLINYSKQEYQKGISNLENLRNQFLNNSSQITIKSESIQQLYLFLSRCYYNLGQMDQARIILEEATSVSPSNANYFELLSNMYAQNGNFDSAILYMEKAIQISPNNTTLLEKLNNLKGN